MSAADPYRDRLVLPVAAVVLVGWIMSLGFAVVTSQFTALSIVTPVMLLLAGYVFGSNFLKPLTRSRDE